MTNLCGTLNDMRSAVVPYGCYEVQVNKIHFKETKEGEPVISIWFEVLKGEFKNDIILYEKKLTRGFWIHQACELVRGMNSGLDVYFEEYEQFNRLMRDVFQNVSSNNVPYVLEYRGNDEIEEYEIRSAC